MRQRRAHACEIGGVHHDRALAEIDIEDLVDRSFHRTDIAQQMADSAVAMPGLGFGSIDRFVDGQLAARRFRELLEDQIESAFANNVVHDPGAR